MTAITPPHPPAGTTGPGTTEPDGREPDGLESLGRWRLRPGVSASALAGGLHLRGWEGSVTLEGSPALPVLWRLLEQALRTGAAAELSARAAAGTPVRAGLCTLIGQLHAHGMLVAEPGPPAGAPAGEWLLAVAERPAEAATALAGCRVEVRAADQRDALASAAVRALARTGISAVRAPEEAAGPAGRVLVRARGADGTEWAVGAVVQPGGAFVTPVGPLARARADTAALARGLWLNEGPPPPTAPSAGLTALVAGAAVQRLLCGPAGLADPLAGGAEGRGQRPGLPVVLVAGEHPLRSGHHPWAAGAARAAPPPATLAEALDGVAALTDERLGVLPAPLAGDLPQLPAALAGCVAPGGGLLTAGAARADLARLDALCRTAELRCGGGRPGVVVGAGPGHALGRALRRAALRTPPPGPGAAPWDPYRGGHPQARHWWRVLTDRLGVRARLRLTPLDPGGTVHRADVREGADGTGRLLGQAVEATARDAAAFAALAAVVRVRAEALRPSGRHITAPGGELCPLAAAGAEPAPWEDERWAAGWWAAVAGREAALHTALRGLTGVRTAVWEPPGPEERTVAAALRACGFTVLEVQDAGGEGRP